MQVDDQDSESRPLTQGMPRSNDMINTRENISGTQDPRQQKRKKYIKWGIIGGIILIAVILAIVLPLTLKSSGGGGGGNGPVPQPPIDKQNPYNADPGKVVNSQVSITGILGTSGPRSPAPQVESSHFEDVASGQKSLADHFKAVFSSPDHAFQIVGESLF